LKDQRPDVYATVLEGDAESRERFSGHGSALAQGYNHIILPLANDRDLETQVTWGIEDFRHRFGRDPEGMWLPETAVDTRSLEALTRHGIRFTILAPNQARRVRRIGDEEWGELTNGEIDPTMPYRVSLPSGAFISAFVYDGPISRTLAFENLLDNGETFADRLMSAFRDDRQHAQLVNIATDGETYGHHRKHADMALSYALRKLSGQDDVRVTNYGEYLESHPPEFELELHDNSSWSCVHGVERWKSDCGCNSGMKPGWHQHWRGPLRTALDWLRDKLAAVFEEEGRKLFRSPWAARDTYIHVILDRNPERRARFLADHGLNQFGADREVRAFQLLEMQRHALLMYTSCGWFFDELSGIETVQVIFYAARALQLAEQLTRTRIEPGFLDLLQHVHSNLAEHGDGREIYLKWVKPAMVDLPEVAAHYAVSSLFENYPEVTRVYSHEVRREDTNVHAEGRMKLGVGRIHVQSEITQENGVFNYGVLHLGDHNLSGGVRPYDGPEAYQAMQRDIVESFERADVPDLIRAVDRQFGSDTYTLRYLFRDEQRKIVQVLLASALSEAAALYRAFQREHAPMARFLVDIGVQTPSRFRLPIEFALQQDLEELLGTDAVDVEPVEQILEQMRRTGVAVESVSLEYVFRQVLERAAERWRTAPQDPDVRAALERILRVLAILPFSVDLWSAQNAAFDVMKNSSAAMDHEIAEIVAHLGVAVPQPAVA
jgi:alpha-amylase/alpha-mannosidase (GH57 family)